MARHSAINTVGIMKSTILGGTSGYSNPIDLREIARDGAFAVSYTVAPAVTGGTCGVTTLSYECCGVYDGTYVAAGTFGTAGTGGESAITTITPPVAPFIKFKASLGDEGDSIITALLHVR
jgi:hypothetical protein